jgi:hypothetical protein
MPNTVIALKKSATVSAKPSDLANGELAINFADGKLFYKNTAGFIAEISSGSNSFGTVNANGTLVVSDTSGDVLTIVPGNNITVVGDAVNDRVTVGLANDITVPGTITASGIVSGLELVSTNASGDEGGEIKLTKPPNGTLDGGITIDAYQNRIRFFEQGGSARGAFIDLSACIGGAGTNLLASSGSTDTTARTAASAAFDKANSANYFAYLVDANTTAAFARANIAVANVNYVNTAMQAAFAQANNTGPGTNTYLLTVIAGANAAVGTGANAFTTAAAAGANAYMISVQDGSNTAVGTGANAFASATIAGANTAVGAGANAFAVTIGTASNTYLLTTLAGANTAVGTGANAFASATIAGANTAVGTGANAFTTAAAAGANAFMISVQDGSNTAVGAGANNYANATFVKLTAASQVITGDVTIVGNLNFSGNTSFSNVQTLAVTDPLIYLATNNASDIIDIGFFGNYVNATGANVHTGLYREHLDKMYYLFQGYDKLPDNNHIGALSNNMTLAVLNADLRTSNLSLGGVNAISWITASFAKANAALANTTGTFNGTLTVKNDLVVNGNTNIDSGTLYVDAIENRVGIGTISPSDTLHVVGGTLLNGTVYVDNGTIGRVLIMNGPSVYGGIGTSDSFEADMSTDIGILAESGAGLRFYTDGALNERMRITSTGRVGIGRTNPTVKLDVVGTINASNILINGIPISTGGGASVAISDAAPSSPTANSLWWSSDLGKLFIYYNDGSSAQWVETSTSPPIPDTSAISDTANSAQIIASAAFTQANTAANTGIAAFTQANAAFTQANTAASTGVAAFNEANTAETIAIAAFATANNAASTGKAIAMAIVFG